jgi:peptidoglycan/xylan/chitin deacetylase (PgdA/CDA1 family)
VGSLKQRLADAFDAAGLNRALLAAQSLALRPYVRAVNYHDVPPSLAGAFEDQLRDYAARFEPVGPDELRALLSGRWRHRRPGILLTFDDGLRSHADVVAPLLERYGFPGWFMVPVDFVATPSSEQAAFARAHRIHANPEHWGGDGRIAMTWEDVRRMDGSHVIACHTRSHCRLSSSLGDADLEREIAGAKRLLEHELGHAVDTFAWVGGEEESYSASAARAIREAGFTWSFMTNNAPIRPHTDPLQLQRSNVEASFAMALVRFTLSGVYDLLYLAKRARVNRLTSARGTRRSI